VVVHPVADIGGAADTGTGPVPATGRTGPLVVIGCGNLNRSDDGIGVRVIRQLLERHLPHWPVPFPAAGSLHNPPRVQLFDAGTAGMEVMFRARGASALVVVDACRSGSDPGAVFRLPGSEIDTAHTPTYSLHDFRWDHAIYAGRRIFGDSFPSDVTVFLVEAATLELGTELSPAVAAALGPVCSQIDSHVRAWLAAPAH
jgi:hydrogenase maturation protease